jgi:hypothetical protein
MAAASSDDIKLAWAVYRAAQRLQYENWNYSARDIDFENLSRLEKLFFLRCYKFAVEEGAFNRIFGGYETLFANVCDPTSDVLEFKPSLAQQLQDGELLPVVLEAYEEARRQAVLDSEPVGIVRYVGTRERKSIHVSLYQQLPEGVELFAAPQPAPVAPDGMLTIGYMFITADGGTVFSISDVPVPGLTLAGPVYAPVPPQEDSHD